MTPAIKLALEVQVIIDSVEKGKNIPKNLLDAGYVINNKLIQNLHRHHY